MEIGHLVLLLAGGIWGTTVVAQESGNEEEPNAMDMVNCVSLPRVDRTEVVDENTILFYMRDDTIYRNNLPHSCPGLNFEERFMYRVTQNQLCSIDVITIIDDLGFGFVPGASCGLGKFEPISEAAAEEILAAAERGDDE